MIKRMKQNIPTFNDKAKLFKDKETKDLTDKDIRELIILIAKKLGLL